MYQYWEHQDQLLNTPKTQATPVNEASEKCKGSREISTRPRTAGTLGVRNIRISLKRTRFPASEESQDVRLAHSLDKIQK